MSSTAPARRWWVLAALLALASSATAGPADNAATDAAAKAACQELVMDDAIYRDRYDAQPYANLFTEDAVLSVLGVDYQGRAAIRARMENDPDKPVTHHHMSTIKITLVDDKHAFGVSYVTVYSEPDQGTRPVPTAGFLAAGEYHDRFVRTDAGWKIAKREFKPILVPISEPADSPQ